VAVGLVFISTNSVKYTSMLNESFLPSEDVSNVDRAPTIRKTRRIRTGGQWGITQAPAVSMWVKGI
jgi:hypothetical protein